MNTILVAVDFSANSRKTVRFAIQLASQCKAEIIFYHTVNLIAPTVDSTWDYTYYIQFQDEALQQSKNQLSRLIKEVYDKKLPSGVNYSCVCQSGDNVGDQIVSYAKKNKVDFICAGARGHGFLAKLFGNVATYLITNSPIPVYIIPKNYRLKPITNLCYASDMENPEPEIKKVLELATAINAFVKVLHFDYEIGLKENKEKLTHIAQQYESKEVKFQYKKLNALYPLNDHLRRAIAQIKPSLVILFTKQNRTWYDRLVLSSESADLSFTAKVPLLVYRKNKK